MFLYNLKLAIKNFKSNRLVFGGSIATIFLATLCISLLFSYTQNELSMDDFHKRKNDIYLITYQQSQGSKPEIKEAYMFFNFNYKDCPEIEKLTTLKKYEEGELKFTYNNNSYSPAGIIADSAFFEVFDFRLTAGNKATVLSDPDAIVISQNIAEKIFGKTNPMGKLITIANRRQKIYTVKGILAPISSNSTLEFDFIIPDHSYHSDESMVFDKMGGNFILVNKSFNKTEFSKKINKIVQKNNSDLDGRASVFPFSKIYFEGSNIDSKGIFTKYGDKNNINILYTIIAVIFIISLLNFTNLQIININSSIKNIGINKISGAGSKQILLQKLTELLVLIMVSSVAITLSFKIILPYFNQITNINLAPELWQIFFLIVSILVLLIVGAMIYPCILYSYIPITASLKKQVTSNTKLSGRKVLIIAQFTLSFIMLIASVVVVKQLGLLLNKDLGFNSKNIICTQLFHEPLRSDGSREELMKQHQAYLDNFQFEKNELKSQSTIRNFSIGDSPIQPFDMSWKVKNGGKDYSTIKSLTVSPEFSKLLGLQILEGRFFDRNIDQERSKKLVINEAAKKYWGISDINAKQLLSNYWGEYEIIGVVKDFNFQHLSVKPQPLILLFFEDMEDQFMIQFEDGATQAGLQFTKQLFEKNNPGEAFKYTFLSDDIQDLYQKEKRLSKIYILFTIIAYFISSIGLFTISLYDTKRRTKEVGIRKVNGARISEVLVMLNKDFVKWIAIAFVIATPIAYYAMHKWLENFAYKTELSWWIFALAGLLALAIALLTVSLQSWRAATRNPVEALRNE